jgi:hypothetical protein
MREHLVAFVYIMALACVGFAVMYKPLTAQVMQRADYLRRAGVWFAVTAITFLAHHFWLAMLLSAIAVALASRKEHNPAALYCALLFAVPQYQMPIEGLGSINKLIEVDHPRMLALVLLLPAALRLAVAPRAPNPTLRIVDWLFGLYFGYVLVVHATAESITMLMRYMIYTVLDHGLPYYVITRAVVQRRQMFDLMAAFTMALGAMSLVAVFENLRNWLVYESVRWPLGVPPPEMSMYILRVTEDGGYFRSLATAGNSIAMGFLAMLALVWQLALARHYQPRTLGVALIVMLLGGLLAAMSRGPWVGCAVALALGVSFGPNAKQRILWMLGAVPVVLAVLLLHPIGQKFLDLLPFIGSVESENVTYRTQLIERAMIVFWQNPIFGSLQYIHNPALESLRQGQGIIDIVNSYIGVALAYGAVGLLLFVLPAGWALIGAWQARRRLAARDASGEAAGRALMVSLVAVLLVIGTVSHYFHIPIVHWMVVALCTAYAAHATAWQPARRVVVQPVEPARPAMRRPIVRPGRPA